MCLLDVEEDEDDDADDMMKISSSIKFIF